MMRSRSAPPPKTWKNPHGPSRPSSPPVKPSAASSAATTPFSAARATCSGLVIDPKLTRMPLDRLAAIASMCLTCGSLSFNSLAAAAAGAEGADGAGRVKSFVVVIGVDRFGDLALDFEADQERLEERCARRAQALGNRQRRSQGRDGRVSQQPVGAIGRRRQLRVVEVHRVAARPVDERRQRHRGHEGSGAEHRRFLPIGDALDVAANDLRPVDGRAREDDAEAVDQAALGLLDGRDGHVVRLVLTMNFATASVAPLMAAPSCFFGAMPAADRPAGHALRPSARPPRPLRSRPVEETTCRLMRIGWPSTNA